MRLRFLASSCAAAALACVLSSPARAATINVVKTIDATATNDINTDVTGTLTSFQSTVDAAFDAGLGGVANFDAPNGADANLTGVPSFTVGYGAGNAKELTVTSTTNSSTGNVNLTSFSSLTAVSGSRGLIPNATTNVDAWRLAFAGLPAGERITDLGLVVLSRDGLGQQYEVDFFLDGETAVAAMTIGDTISPGKAADDSFLSYSAPAGSGITSVRLRFDTNDSIPSTTTDVRLAIDDLTFVTVPEPASAALLAAAALPMLARRTRLARRSS